MVLGKMKLKPYLIGTDILSILILKFLGAHRAFALLHLRMLVMQRTLFVTVMAIYMMADHCELSVHVVIEADFHLLILTPGTQTEVEAAAGAKIEAGA